MSKAIAEAAIESAEVLARKRVEFVRVQVDPSEIPPLRRPREVLEAVNFVYRRLGSRGLATAYLVNAKEDRH